MYDTDLNIWNSQPFPEVRVNVSNTECLQSLSFSVNELLVMRQVSDDGQRGVREEGLYGWCQVNGFEWFSGWVAQGVGGLMGENIGHSLIESCKWCLVICIL